MVVCTECGADLDHFQHENDCPRTDLQVVEKNIVPPQPVCLICGKELQ